MVRARAVARRFASLLLSLLFVVTPPAAAGTRVDTSQGDKTAARATRIKAKLADIPPQTYIRVRFADGQEMRGRFLSCAEDDFRLQSADTVDIAYTTVKSVKVIKPRGERSWVMHALVIPGIIVGVIIGIGVWAASQTR